MSCATSTPELGWRLRAAARKLAESPWQAPLDPFQLIADSLGDMVDDPGSLALVDALRAEIRFRRQMQTRFGWDS